MTPPELLTSREEDNDGTDPSEHSSGMTDEEASGGTPVTPVMEDRASPATSESTTDFSCPLFLPSVNPESPLFSSNSDARNDEGRTSDEQADENEKHTSHGSSPG